MATMLRNAPRLTPSNGSLAEIASRSILDIDAPNGDLAAAWAAVWQACGGYMLRSQSGAHSLSFRVDDEPVNEAIGHIHLTLDNASAINGARLALMAIMDLCGQAARDAIFALGTEVR